MAELAAGRLRQLEDEKRKFLQHVSHELKTPLTALREGTALLEEGVVGELDESQHEIVEILEQNGIQLQKLIEDLLNFHLAEARLALLDLQPLQLDRMLEDVLTDHKLAMRAKDLEVQLGAAPVLVRGDREKLRTAIDNLISNAVKYSQRDGTIRSRSRTRLATSSWMSATLARGLRRKISHAFLRRFIRGRQPMRATSKGAAWA